MHPQGLRKLLKKLSDWYPGTELIITETGTMDLDDGLKDEYRADWIRQHADQVLKGAGLQ